MRHVEVKTKELSANVEESFKLLRTNLMFCGADKKVIVVTSCMQSEGKSSVTLNLAISLAEIGKKVLLIDADLRKSVLVGRVQLQQQVNGLSHYLSGQEMLDNVVCDTNIQGLHLIFTGTQPPNPVELLSGKVFTQMLEQSRKEYDYVLIDAPPLGQVVDASVIAEVCDGSILVLESGAISYRFAQDVKKQLEKAKCPILGVILNKVDMSKAGYYGKYGKYGNYGTYGK